jgi:hypothetical protein
MKCKQSKAIEVNGMRSRSCLKNQFVNRHKPARIVHEKVNGDELKRAIGDAAIRSPLLAFNGIELPTKSVVYRGMQLAQASPVPCKVL